MKTKERESVRVLCQKRSLRRSKRGRGTPSSEEIAEDVGRCSARTVRRLLGPRAGVVRRHKEAARQQRMRAARRFDLLAQEASLSKRRW